MRQNTKEDTNISIYIERWPLNISPSFDKHACTEGLPWWSCLTEQNLYWLRRDGRFVEFNTTVHVKYTDALRAVDKAYPMFLDGIRRANELDSFKKESS